MNGNRWTVGVVLREGVDYGSRCAVTRRCERLEVTCSPCHGEKCRVGLGDS